MSESNKQCFLAILQHSQTKLRTQEILDLTDTFPDLCRGCKSGSDVILAGMKLFKEGKINREIGKGGYYWSLIT